MAANGPSSLDRFLWGRGQELLDPRWLQGDATVPFVTGIVQAAFGTGIALMALAIGGDSLILLLAVAVLLVGAGIWMACSAWRRVATRRTAPVSAVPLSLEGERLIHRICSHIGYYNWQDEVYGRSLTGLRGRRTASQVLREDLFRLMDDAAHQFNRIDGLLRERSSTVDKSLKAMEPNVRAACRETMAIVVNHASWIDTYPENEDDHRRTIEAKTARLAELADRIYKLVGAEPTLTETLATHSLLDDVIDRLHLENEARAEIGDDGPSVVR